MTDALQPTLPLACPGCAERDAEIARLRLALKATQASAIAANREYAQVMTAVGPKVRLMRMQALRSAEEVAS